MLCDKIPKLSIVCNKSIECDLPGCVVCKCDKIDDRSVYFVDNKKSFSFYDDTDLSYIKNEDSCCTSPKNLKRSCDNICVNSPMNIEENNSSLNVRVSAINKEDSKESENEIENPKKKRAFEFDCEMVYW